MSGLEPTYANIIKQELEIGDLKRQVKALTEKVTKAERIGGNAAAQVSYMVTEINQAFGLNVDSTPADTVQSVRDAVSMLQERDGLCQQVAELSANLAQSEKACENRERRLEDIDGWLVKHSLAIGIVNRAKEVSEKLTELTLKQKKDTPMNLVVKDMEKAIVLAEKYADECVLVEAVYAIAQALTETRKEGNKESNT